MKTVKRVSSVVLSVLFLTIPLVAFTQRQALYDWLRLRNYTPPAAVSQLAAVVTMTDKAQHLFYINHPQLINQATEFRQACPQDEQTIVLGCYLSSQRGISIYDVSDARLTGVQQVTAAHEMLHAAYDRLNAKDKKYIDGLLEAYYSAQTNQRIKDTIDAYKKSEPDNLVNEMHSIFGTEIASLPKPLEDYYKQYFADRSKVVALSASYEAEFSGRLAKIKNYDQQLSSLKQSINGQQAGLEEQLPQLEAERQRLNNLRDSENISAYNAAVPGFNAQIEAYNKGVDKLRRDVQTYNSLVEVRNNLATELRALDSAIDTRLTPQTTH